MREIVLDTETTGLDPRTGHRLIEVACVELEDFLPTGRTFHRYVHPDRPIDADAERVHGISLAFLNDKPRFHEADVCDAFLDFVGEAVLIAHNAGFDRGFINAELERADRASLPDARWVDTLSMAQKRFPGMYNSLDALCKRFKISLADRDKHGALIDAQLLAAVYLELRGGKERGLDLAPVVTQAQGVIAAGRIVYGARPRPLAARSTEAERAAHAEFVRRTLKDKALWLGFELEGPTVP
ncbi:MAG TPA: DNA polymerase III subunit epsilon [Caulobacteraceae bacterium]|jgi:DNA polymerase-3 subunit epsilon|nr:DNA polymerase III subunit epsilon [Caulobacteraceae bacterium]